MINLIASMGRIDFHFLGECYIGQPYNFSRIAYIRFDIESNAAIEHEAVTNDCYNVRLIVTSKELIDGEVDYGKSNVETKLKAESLELAFHKVKLLLYKKGWPAMNLELPEEV